MDRVLFIKANNPPLEESVSVQLYTAFLESYKASHPNGAVEELDLFHAQLPYMDADMIIAVFKKRRGIQLTFEELSKLQIADRYLDQFLSFEKVVFAFSLWNLAIPAVLHTYIDYLNRAGTTFKYTPQGSVGLVKGKKVALLNARGGVYSKSPESSSEMAVNYVLRNLKLFGISDVTSVIVEGHQQYPDCRSEIIAGGIKRANEAAKIF